MIVSDLTQELEESNFQPDQWANMVVIARSRSGEVFAVTAVEVREAKNIQDIDRVILTISSLAELGLSPIPPYE